MCGDEVHRRPWPSARVLVEITRAGDPVTEVGHAGRTPRPGRADGVAIAAVPLRPRRGEGSDLVAAPADVPRFGDEFDGRQQRVGVDGGQQRRGRVETVGVARERGRQVEPVPVHAHLAHPVAQRVQNQPHHVWGGGVQRVAAPGHVPVPAWVAGLQTVVGGVVQPAQRQRRAAFAAFGGVVEHHIENDLDAGRVQGVGHRAELGDRVVRGRIAGMRGEETQGVVTPVVDQAPLGQHRFGDVRVHRQQFDRGDAEGAQMVDDRRVRQARVGAALRGWDARVRLGEALHVQLVDDRLGPGDAWPVTGRDLPVVDHDALRDERRGVAPVRAGRVRVGLVETGDRGMGDKAAGQHPGIGLDEQLGRVVAQAAFGGVRAVRPQPVALARSDARQVAVPHPAVAFG